MSSVVAPGVSYFFFFFNDTATTEIYTLSLHDALPIWRHAGADHRDHAADLPRIPVLLLRRTARRDRKSTRLNSSHSQISYAVFCLKKKKQHARSARGDDVPDRTRLTPALSRPTYHRRR